ncbi:hypothetical protein QW060_24870 [Myroides ceti]|uniref:Uncharacterized protein n=1 Tax=Paenimyroides ceti TaxID=395087 RepID=A0ABT8D005_9FLAO|nr:hypothetical protein [Paenimyroides ceti]MDN3710119.1 hypothetical protein [Paenimyroides ceti]
MYPNIRFVDVENNQAFWGSKKYALTLGIKLQNTNFYYLSMLKTDLHQKTWLMQMSSHLRLIKPLY